MKAVAYDEIVPVTYSTPEYVNIVRPYFGTVGELCEGPQTFLVEMPTAGSTVKPHFHDVDQYQVFVKGDGKLGKKDAGPIVFHYADAYTPYGPIVAGAEGLSFYTIRAGCAGGYFGMPGSGHLRKGRNGRNIAGKFEINQPLPASGQSTRESLLQADEGVEVIGLRMGPNATAEGIPLTGGAQYYLVATGSLVHAGRDLPPLSMLLAQPGEEPLRLQAGPSGAEVLIMQLPGSSDRPGSQVGTLAERGLKAYANDEGGVVKA